MALFFYAVNLANAAPVARIQIDILLGSEPNNFEPSGDI